MEKEKIKKYTHLILIFLILLSGVYLRTRFYIMDNVFEDDECRVAIPLFTGTLKDMILPIGAFSTSPIIMIISKIITDIVGFKEYALKFISYIASLISLIMFYKLTKEYLQRKISIYIANFLFAINLILVYFAATFKIYSLEAMFSVLCLYYFPKINVSELKLKNLIILSIIISLIPLISLPALFFIAALFIINTIKNYNIKEYYKKLPILIIPPAVVMFFYYKFNLSIVKQLQYKAYADFWNNDIFGRTAIETFSKFWGYMSASNCFTIIPLILLISYITIIVIKKQYKIIDIWILVITAMVITASVLHLYPIYDRTSLYIYPLVFISVARVLDILNYKRLYFYLFLTGIIYSFNYYFNIYNFSNVYKPESIILTFSPKNLMLDMQSKFNPETDIILTNQLTLYSFLYYKTITGFDANFLMIPYTEANNEKDLLVFLKNLDPKYNYWIYIVKDVAEPPLNSYLTDWMKDKNKAYERKERESYLYYIKSSVKVN